MKATLQEKKLVLFGPDRLTNGKPIWELKSVLAAVVENNYLDIVIDLSRTQYIDSSGLGELVASYTTVRNRGGSLCLNRLTSKAKEFLQMAKLRQQVSKRNLIPVTPATLCVRRQDPEHRRLEMVGAVRFELTTF